MPDPIVVTAHEITANYTSFTILRLEEYEFASESVTNASYWKYDMRFYKDGSELTSDEIAASVSMIDYNRVSSFSYNGGSNSNDEEDSWRKQYGN